MLSQSYKNSKIHRLTTIVSYIPRLNSKNINQIHTQTINVSLATPMENTSSQEPSPTSFNIHIRGFIIQSALDVTNEQRQRQPEFS